MNNNGVGESNIGHWGTIESVRELAEGDGESETHSFDRAIEMAESEIQAEEVTLSGLLNEGTVMGGVATKENFLGNVLIAELAKAHEAGSNFFDRASGNDVTQYGDGAVGQMGFLNNILSSAGVVNTYSHKPVFERANPLPSNYDQMGKINPETADEAQKDVAQSLAASRERTGKSLRDSLFNREGTLSAMDLHDAQYLHFLSNDKSIFPDGSPIEQVFKADYRVQACAGVIRNESASPSDKAAAVLLLKESAREVHTAVNQLQALKSLLAPQAGRVEKIKAKFGRGHLSELTAKAGINGGFGGFEDAKKRALQEINNTYRSGQSGFGITDNKTRALVGETPTYSN